MVMTFGFVAAEGAAGWWAGSLALLSDAAHNLADGLALALAWYALAASARRADARRTFGYHRVGVLAAAVNAVALVVIALGITWEAWQRIQHPAPVAGGTVILVAAGALAMNLLVSWWLRAGARTDLNVRGAYLHMLADAAASAAVIVGGIVIHLTGWPLVDPILSLVIAALILWSSWGILDEAVGVLLEAVPARMDIQAVGAAISAVPGVLGVHDLHVWTIGSGVVACSCHIIVAEQAASSGQQVQRAVTAALAAFGITHTTIQIEVSGCAVDGNYCSQEGGEGHEHDHVHDHHGHEH